MIPKLLNKMLPVLTPENWHRGLIVIKYVLVADLGEGNTLLSVTVTVNLIFVPEAIGVPVMVRIRPLPVKLSPAGRPDDDHVNGVVIPPLAVMFVEV